MGKTIPRERFVEMWGKENILLNPFLNKPLFLRVCSKSFEHTVGKGEIVRNEKFLLFAVFSTLSENLPPFLSKSYGPFKVLQTKKQTGQKLYAPPSPLIYRCWGIKNAPNFYLCNWANIGPTNMKRVLVLLPLIFLVLRIYHIFCN